MRVFSSLSVQKSPYKVTGIGALKNLERKSEAYRPKLERAYKLQWCTCSGSEATFQ